jgi:hypothetical protein
MVYGTHAIQIMFDPAIEAIVEAHLETRLQWPTKQLVVILRGMPGSGKSTFASFLKLWANSKYLDTEIVSADNVRSSCDDGHEQCQRLFADLISRHVSIIVVDNANIQKQEWEPYGVENDFHRDEYDYDFRRDEYDPRNHNVAQVHVNFVCSSIDHGWETARRSSSYLSRDFIERRFSQYQQNTALFNAQHELIPTFNTWDATWDRVHRYK